MNDDTKLTPTETPAAAPQATTPTPETAQESTEAAQAAASPTAAKNGNKTVLTILIIIGVIVSFGIVGIITLMFNPSFLMLATHIAASNKPVDASMPSMAKALCNNFNYTTLYQRPDEKESAIIQCEKMYEDSSVKPIYSITNANEGKDGYYYNARATYIGSINEPQMDQFLSKYKYLFRQSGEDPDVTTIILFVEADTEEAAVDEAVDSLYNYLADFNKDRVVFNTMDVAIFYAEDLSEVKDAKDYLILSSAIGLQKSMPYGNGFGDFVYQAEDPSENINWLIENTDLYPAATTKAVKENRHAFYHIKSKNMFDHKLYFSKDELREWLVTSFVK